MIPEYDLNSVFTANNQYFGKTEQRNVKYTKGIKKHHWTTGFGLGLCTQNISGVGKEGKGSLVGQRLTPNPD